MHAIPTFSIRRHSKCYNVSQTNSLFMSVCVTVRPYLLRTCLRPESKKV